MPLPSVGGSDTTNFIPIWLGSKTVGNSTLFQRGGKLGVGKTKDVNGSVNAISFTGNGAALTSVNAATLGNLAPSAFAQLRSVQVALATRQGRELGLIKKDVRLYGKGNSVDARCGLRVEHCHQQGSAVEVYASLSRPAAGQRGVGG